MAGFNAFGTLLKMGDGASPEVFTTIAEVYNIGGPSLSADSLDVTSHESASGYREFIPGMKDGGEVSFDLRWDPSDSTHDQSTGIMSKLGSAASNWKIVYPASVGETISFSGFLTSLEPAAPHDDALDASATIKITGKPTLAASS